ncbi:MAG TPA: hypothetical protein VFR28_07055, partial [Allosphingosinicella sp.]|nr:hypothetical protein [Allosphingosinicella sp.]
MRLRSGLVAALLAGAAPAEVQAQEMAKPSGPAEPAPTPTFPSTQEAPAPAEPGGETPPEMEIIGPDGQPLPPERQRELRERLKDAL